MDSSLICRICHDGAINEKLIDPCNCSGTVALVHASCLEKWLSTSNTQRCEICNYGFSIQKRNKPLTRQSFCQWFKFTLNTNLRVILSDIFFVFTLTPLCISAVYLCGLGAVLYKPYGTWETIGLIFLCVTLFCTYILWLFVTLRFHVNAWKNWCKSNQEIKIIMNHQLYHTTSRIFTVNV